MKFRRSDQQYESFENEIYATKCINNYIGITKSRYVTKS